MLYFYVHFACVWGNGLYNMYKLLSFRPDPLLEPVIDYNCIFVFHEKKKKKKKSILFKPTTMPVRPPARPLSVCENRYYF